MPTLTSKGQVTVPKRIRDHLGLKPGSQIDFVVEDDRVVLRRRGIPRAVFDKWRGFLSEQFPNRKAVDDFIEEIRGERLPWPPSDKH